MKRLLFLTPFLPSNRTAGQNYTLRLLERLTTKVEIDLCLFHYPDEVVPEYIANARVIRTYRTSALRMLGCAAKLPFLHPVFSCRFRFDLLRFLLRERRRYDFFYFDFSQTFIYSLFLRNRVGFLMVHDVISQLFGRRKGLVNKISAAFCNTTEGFILKRSSAAVLCFSEKDRALISRYSDREATVVDFLIDDRIAGIDYDTTVIRDQFCFYAAWHRRENTQGLEWFLDRVLPKTDKNIEFVVVGGGLPEGPVKRIRDLSNVTYLGFVDNPFPVIAQSRALLAPLFEGAGVKVKVVEALACGVPVIGSPVAFEGIEFASGLPVFSCNTTEDYVGAIKTVPSYTSSVRKEFKARFNSVYPRMTFDKFLSRFDHESNGQEAEAARLASIP